ncbi:hypothetical protein, variant [Aphanomyces astaci]|uniref:TRAF-type domain-containing protein n=1 Tax=Aphanomyces astaci TaxID=112090 RepID=W4H7D6_APHAT|nr:hypothetical protein, variant [Aphanomyces astaci]ETV87204.1 hypothetical protein, variant [Aphanomyces astaci]|eukprot:XP_009824003.1 hypothetical protein, variant [Aphanomyces astaci]
MSLSKRTRRPVASRPSMARPSVPFTGTLTCYSVAFIDKPDLEFGDKKVLLEIQCLKIPLPLLFKLSVPASKTSSESYHYCGVLEFSAPAGQMYAPYWMMQQLGVDEGGTVHLESALSIPKGLFCQLQPDQMDFLDIAATVGPKVLLESAMRRYSCLSVDGCIVIEYGDQKYFLKVLQVKPTPVVHLFGDVDLEVDFKAPDNVDPRRPNSARPTGSHELCPSHSFNTAPAPTVDNNTSAATSYGRRLADGGFVSSTAPHSSSNPSFDASIPTTSVPRNLSLKAAQIKAKKQTEGLDPAKFKAIKAFATPGQSIAPPPSSPSLSSIAPYAQDNQADHRSTALVPPTVPLPTAPGAPTTSPPSSSCPFCLADVPPAHVDLHMLRCKQHTAYHRFACTTCNAKVLQTDAQEHVHCHKCDFVGAADTVVMHTNEFHVSVRCTCGASMAADALSAHKCTACPLTFMPCALCSLSFQRHKFDAHYSVCSNRTQQCEVCNKYVNVVSYAQHCDQCADLPSVASHAKSPPTEMPCTNPCESPTSKDITSPVDDDNTATMYRCPYCTDATFPNMFALDRHTESQCPIANLNSAKDAPILRGKLRRKADLQKPTAVSKAGGERIGQPKQSPPRRRRLLGTPSNNQQQTLPRTGSNELRGSHNNRMGETVLQGSTVGLHASKTSRLNQVEALIGRKPSSVARPTKR